MKKIIIYIALCILLVGFVNGSLTDDMIFYYTLDTDSYKGSTVIDSVNNWNATAVLLVNGTSGKINQGTDYTDGVSSYINISYVAFEFGADDSYSFNVWLYGTHNGASAQMIFSTAQAGTIRTQLNTDDTLQIRQHDGGAYTIDFDFDYSPYLGSWTMFTITYNGTTNNITAWINGSKVGSDTGGLGTATDKWDSIGNHYTPSNANEWQGTLDEAGLWARQLTIAEIQSLYSYGVAGTQYPFNSSPNNPPVVTLYNPSFNNTHTNANPVNVSFLLTNDVVNETANCTVTLDGQDAVYVNAENNTIIWVNSSTLEGVKDFNATCYDAGGITRTGIYDIIVDRTSPVINTFNPLSDNTSLYYENLAKWINFNATFNDTYLFGYNVSVYYPNGSLFYNNYSVNLTVSGYNFVRNVSIDGVVEGTYQVCYYVEDDHTAKQIPDYEIVNSQQSISYTTPSNVITLESVEGNLNGIYTAKQTDRYTFQFIWKNARKEHEIVLGCDDTLYYRGDLYEYPTFVCGKNWVDFVTPDYNIDDFENVVVKNLNNGKYSVNFKTFGNVQSIEFNSLGGLNNATQCYDFDIETNNPPVITVTVPTNQNVTVQNGSSLSFSTTATDDEGEPLTYRYYLNGSLNYTGASFSFHVPTVVGNYIMLVNVTDNNSLWDSYTWTLNVTNMTQSFIGYAVWGYYLNPFTLGFYLNMTNGSLTKSYYDTDFDGTIETNISLSNPSLWNISFSRPPFFMEVYYNNVNLSVNNSITTQMYVGVVNMSCYDLIGNPLTCDDPVLYLNGGNHYLNLTVASYFHNYTYIGNPIFTNYIKLITVPFTYGYTAEENVTGYYSTNLSIFARSNYFNLTTCNYTFNAYNFSYSTIVYGSPNSSVGLINGSYNVTAVCNGTALSVANITIYNTSQDLFINMYPSNSVNFSFYDFNNPNSVITGLNISLSLFNGASASNHTTDTGWVFVQGLTVGDYTALYGANGYNDNNYYFTVTEDSTNQISLFLLNSSDTELYKYVLRDQNDNEISGAFIRLQRKYESLGGQFKSVSECKTNDAGECYMYLVESISIIYREVVLIDNSVVKATEPSPIITLSTEEKVITIRVNTGSNLFEQIQKDLGVYGAISLLNNVSYFEFIDSYNAITSGCLRVESRTFPNVTYRVLDLSCVVGTNGNLSYNYNSLMVNRSEFLFVGLVNYSGVLQEISFGSDSFNPRFNNQDENDYLFLTVLIFTFLSLATIWIPNYIIQIIVNFGGLLMFSIMGFTLLGVPLVMTFFSLGLFLTWTRKKARGSV